GPGPGRRAAWAVAEGDARRARRGSRGRASPPPAGALPLARRLRVDSGRFAQNGDTPRCVFRNDLSTASTGLSPGSTRVVTDPDTTRGRQKPASHIDPPLGGDA